MVTKIESIANMFIYIILKNICHIKPWYWVGNKRITLMNDSNGFISSSDAHGTGLRKKNVGELISRFIVCELSITLFYLSPYPST